MDAAAASPSWLPTPRLRSNSTKSSLIALLLLLLQMLHTAKQDERVRGVLAVLGGRENFGGMAQLQELRNALLDFRVGVLCVLGQLMPAVKAFPDQCHQSFTCRHLIALPGAR
jgi:hypothetical protein